MASSPLGRLGTLVHWCAGALLWLGTLVQELVWSTPDLVSGVCLSLLGRPCAGELCSWVIVVHLVLAGNIGVTSVRVRLCPLETDKLSICRTCAVYYFVNLL